MQINNPIHLSNGTICVRGYSSVHASGATAYTQSRKEHGGDMRKSRTESSPIAPSLRGEPNVPTSPLPSSISDARWLGACRDAGCVPKERRGGTYLPTARGTFGSWTSEQVWGPLLRSQGSSHCCPGASATSCSSAQALWQGQATAASTGRCLR